MKLFSTILLISNLEIIERMKKKKNKKQAIWEYKCKPDIRKKSKLSLIANYRATHL